MSSVSSISSSAIKQPIAAVQATASSQQTLAALQAQMTRYSSAASGKSGPANADYKALQAAISSGNVTDAQAALARLQRDSRAATPAVASSKPGTGSATAAVDHDGDHDAGVESPAPGTLDATA